MVSELKEFSRVLLSLLGIQTHIVLPLLDFYLGSRHPNSSLHGQEANIVLTVPSSHPPKEYFYRWILDRTKYVIFHRKTAML